MVWETVLTLTTSDQNYTFNPDLYIYRVKNDASIGEYVTLSGTSTLVPAKSTLEIVPVLYNITLKCSSSSNNVFLQRELKNTAPTQPGAFNQPTGELEIGDTRTISWGASTDAEGPVTYTVEVSVNGGAWAYINGIAVNISMPSFSYVIPSASTLKFRVYASDGGLNSPYRESPTYTVTKPKYYWSKYNVVNGARGNLIQTGIFAVEGTYPVDGIHPADGLWYVRGSRVNQSIAPTGAFSAPAPATILKPSQGVAVTFAASTAPNISLYELEYRYNSGLWTTLGTNNTALTRSFTPTTDKTLTNVQFRVRAKNTSNVYSDYVYSEFYNIEHNAKPTITLTTADNLVLTENANIVIAGEAKDTDNGNVLSVKYQVNSGNTLAIATAISNGTAPLAYSKTLQFRRGTLYDGETAVIENLIAGQTYTLKTWAEDDQGGKSEVQTRSFTVVPNRAPILTVNAVTTQSNKINNDTMTITGTVSDPENQNILVKYKINDGTLTQIYSGTGGNYTFNVKLGDTNDGDNIIEIQATDTYDLLTTKKLKFTKTKNKVSLLKSSARYKATIPATGITGVVSWFERENGDLTIVPDASLRNTGETEVFAAMTKSNTAPVNADVTEDQYQITAAAAKTAVVLRVTLTKAATASDKGIKKITGALQ